MGQTDFPNGWGKQKSLFWKKRPKRIPPNQRRRLHAAGLRHGCGHLCCPPLLLSALISAHLLRHSHDRTSPSLHRLALFSSPLLLFSSRGLLLSAAFLAASLRLAVPLIGGCRIRGRHASLAAAPLVHCAPLFTAAPLYLHCRASVCCTCCRMCDVSDDAKNDVPCVVCIVSHVREERFVLSDSSQSGSLFSFLDLVASATIRIRSVLGGAPH